MGAEPADQQHAPDRERHVAAGTDLDVGVLVGAVQAGVAEGEVAGGADPVTHLGVSHHRCDAVVADPAVGVAGVDGEPGRHPASADALVVVEAAPAELDEEQSWVTTMA